ncbi:MAG: DUF5034 domain-containing protein [Bacteroidales bacterium]|nr:DUF5034 domain-containing protein [Bacteroidales bacterium]
MPILKKTLFIILTVFVLRTLSGCLNCKTNNPQLFDFDIIEITGLDNTGEQAIESITNIMNNSAVAFAIRLRSNEEYWEERYNISYIGFSQANAMQPCPEYFAPNQEIDQIEIITLKDISAEVKANTDVTELFVGFAYEPFVSEYLYFTLDELYQKINPKFTYNAPKQDFQLFLTQDIENFEAQFIINIRLSDNRVLSDTTHLIMIINK